MDYLNVIDANLFVNVAVENTRELLGFHMVARGLAVLRIGISKSP